jgi:hypothetical protein
MRYRRFTILAVVALLAGCAGPGAPTDSSDAPLLSLRLPPQSFGRDVAFGQLVTGEFAEETQSVRFRVEINGNRLVMAAFTHIGAPLFVLEEQGDALGFENLSGGELPFDPRFMLADFKIANWPAEILAPAVADAGLRFEEFESPPMREVWTRDGTLVMRVLFPGDGRDDGAMTIEHFDHPYRLRVTPVTEGEAS